MTGRLLLACLLALVALAVRNAHAGPDPYPGSHKRPTVAEGWYTCTPYLDPTRCTLHRAVPLRRYARTHARRP